MREQFWALADKCINRKELPALMVFSAAYESGFTCTVCGDEFDQLMELCVCQKSGKSAHCHRRDKINCCVNGGFKIKKIINFLIIFIILSFSADF
jgi:hypothetical protein